MNLNYRKDIDGLRTISVLAVVCVLIYNAEKFMDFGKSVLATTLFVSNINFWQESGYFDAPSQLKPLLHTWSLAVEEQRFKEEGGREVHLVDTLNEAPADANGEYLFTLGFERTVKAILELDRDVVVVAQLPEIGYDVPSANFIAHQTGRDINKLIAPSLDEYLVRNQKTFAIFETFKEKYGIQVIEPWKVLCRDGICRVSINEIPLYNDDDHLSIFGSELVAPIFDPLFESLKSSGN